MIAENWNTIKNISAFNKKNQTYVIIFYIWWRHHLLRFLNFVDLWLLLLLLEIRRMWLTEYECTYLEVLENYYLLYRIIINIKNIMPWKSQHFFLSLLLHYTKNLYRMLVICLKVNKKHYFERRWIQETFQSSCICEVTLRWRFVSDLKHSFKRMLLSLKSGMSSF